MEIHYCKVLILYAVTAAALVALGVQLAPLAPISLPPDAAVYHLHVYPVLADNVGNVTATGVQFAVNVTVPLVSLKFLKYVFFVDDPVHDVVGFAAVPVLAPEPNPALVDDVQPLNVCALL